MADNQNHDAAAIFRTQAEHEQRVADMLEDARIRFESGDAWSLARAIAICGQYKVVMPRWVASAFMNGFEDIALMEKKSWGEVLGLPYKKNTALNPAKDRRDKIWRVYKAVNNYLSKYPDEVDKNAFEAVAEEFGMKVSTVRDYYHDVSRHKKKYLLRHKTM